MNKEQFEKDLQQVEADLKKIEANFLQALGIKSYIQMTLKKMEVKNNEKNSGPLPVSTD